MGRVQPYHLPVSTPENSQTVDNKRRKAKEKMNKAKFI
jgi:hypothetical protein